jgi:hypothetical protein
MPSFCGWDCASYCPSNTPLANGCLTSSSLGVDCPEGYAYDLGNGGECCPQVTGGGGGGCGDGCGGYNCDTTNMGFCYNVQEYCECQQFAGQWDDYFCTCFYNSPSSLT